MKRNAYVLGGTIAWAKAVYSGRPGYVLMMGKTRNIKTDEHCRGGETGISFRV